MQRRGAAVRERDTTAARELSSSIGTAVVDCGVYDEGQRQGGRIELETALNRADACRDGFAWIGLHDGSPAVVEKVASHFKLHPLAVEDAAPLVAPMQRLATEQARPAAGPADR